MIQGGSRAYRFHYVNMKNQIELRQNEPVINVASNSENPTEAILSNLANTPFKLDGKTYASVEAFWQWLKYSKEEDRDKIAGMSWIASKKIGDAGDNREGHFEYLWRQYIVGSQEHHELMRRAIRAKLEQNQEVLKLLLETWNTPIIHEPKKKDGTSYPDSTTIPAAVFSGMLMELRDEFLEAPLPVNAWTERVAELFSKTAVELLDNRSMKNAMLKPSITLEWITFFDPTALEAGLLVFKDAVDTTDAVSIWQKSIRNAWMGYFILTYPSKEQARDDYHAFVELYNSQGKTRVIPKVVTVFEYKEMAHIAISVEEKIDTSKGLVGTEYHWFVVNPVIYLQQAKEQAIYWPHHRMLPKPNNRSNEIKQS